MREWDEDGAITYRVNIWAKYNADSSVYETTNIQNQFFPGDEVVAVNDTFVYMGELRPRNGGTIRETTRTKRPADSSEPIEIIKSIDYDSVSVSNDTVFNGYFSIEGEAKKILRPRYHTKTLTNKSGLTLYHERSFYRADTVYSGWTDSYRYTGAQLVHRAIVEYYLASDYSDITYTEETFSYPRSGYRITRRSETKDNDENAPRIETEINDFDRFGSNIRTRVFSDFDTTAIPVELVEREFAGDGDGLVLTLRRIYEYDEAAQRLLPVSLYEVFGRFESFPVSAVDAVRWVAKPCDVDLGSDAMRVEVPLGSRISLVSVTGRTLWNATAPGVESGSGEVTTLTAPLPVRGAGLHVLVGRGRDWHCVTKVLR